MAIHATAYAALLPIYLMLMTVFILVLLLYTLFEELCKTFFLQMKKIYMKFCTKSSRNTYCNNIILFFIFLKL